MSFCVVCFAVFSEELAGYVVEFWVTGGVVAEFGGPAVVVLA